MVIEIPDTSKMMPHQVEVIQDPTRFKVLIWHRRCRKTTTAISELLKQACLVKGVYWHVFPTFAEAKNAVWIDPNMLFRVIPPEIILKKNESELSVTLKNGSIIKLVGSDNPDRLRGAGPLGMVLDEYDTMKDDVWPIVEPILRANGGWAWFIGTPKGRAKLYDLYNRGQNGTPEWKSWLLKASQSGVIPGHELQAAKETATTNLFNQEYECEFLEGVGSVFRNVRDVCTAAAQKPIPGHLYVIGVDLAKVQDWTVLTVYDRATNKQVYQDRFQKLDWPYQKSRIIAAAQFYNNALCYVDATGIGDPIVDDLLRARVSVEPIKLTNEIKKEIVEKLSIWIDQRRIRMLPTEETLLEFDNFTYEISRQGRIVYNAREGYHDDIVISHGLAVWGLNPLIRPVQDEPKSQIQTYYEELTSGGQDKYLEYEEFEDF